MGFLLRNFYYLVLVGTDNYYLFDIGMEGGE